MNTLLRKPLYIDPTDPVLYLVGGATLIFTGMCWQLYRLTRSQKRLWELGEIFIAYMQVDFQEEVDEAFETIVENYDDTE